MSAKEEITNRVSGRKGSLWQGIKRQEKRTSRKEKSEAKVNEEVSVCTYVCMYVSFVKKAFMFLYFLDVYDHKF